MENFEKVKKGNVYRSHAVSGKVFSKLSSK